MFSFSNLALTYKKDDGNIIEFSLKSFLSSRLRAFLSVIRDGSKFIGYPGRRDAKRFFSRKIGEEGDFFYIDIWKIKTWSIIHTIIAIYWSAVK